MRIEESCEDWENFGMFKLDLQVDDQTDESEGEEDCRWNGANGTPQTKADTNVELQAAADSFKSARLRFQDQVVHFTGCFFWFFD